MKFRKFGKALLMGALSVGAVLSVTSCVQSYTVGFLYVTGTQTAGTTGQGIISGFKIDHNTGKLSSVNGLPVSSGGSYPGRAILLAGQRFLYVLNQGGANCSASSPCTAANIVQFAIGSNGILSQQQTFYSAGNNPFRILADPQGNYVFILDHDAPSSASCSLVLGSGVTSCGDVTVLKVDPTTGRLSIVVNAQVTSASGQPLPYFPVPANPIDMVFTSNTLLTMSGTPATGDVSFPYSYNASNGQLTVSQNGTQPLNIHQGTAIQSGNSLVYVLDNEPLTYTPTNGGAPITVASQLIPYAVGTGGALQSQPYGAIPNDPTMSNPMFLLAESKSKWIYVANQGSNTNPNLQQSGITGYVIDTSTKQLNEMPTSPFGTGSGPTCLVEDPSNQFIYTANANDSTVTGRALDVNAGTLNKLPGAADKAYGLPGPAAYCLVNGRTS